MAQPGPLCVATTTCSNLPKQIAGKSTHRSKWSWLPGRREASSIGGCETARNGGVAYAVPTAVNGGLELVIFIP